jgi:hypothetical protein
MRAVAVRREREVTIRGTGSKGVWRGKEGRKRWENSCS